MTPRLVIAEPVTARANTVTKDVTPAGSVSWMVGVALVVLAAAVAALFWRTAGTPDVDIWHDWANLLVLHGPIRGYRVINADYPPGASLLIWITSTALPGMAFRPALKLLLVTFLIATSMLLLGSSRKPMLSAFAYVSLAINALGLMYLDVLVAPFLVGGVWAMRRQRFVLGTGLLSTACLMKWQPAVILPLALIHLLKQRDTMSPARWQATVRGTLAVAAGIGGLALFVYGWPVLDSFYRASRHGALSNFGANGPWLLTWWFERHSPERLASGGIVEIVNASRVTLRILSAIMLVAYIAVARRYWNARRRDVTAWLQYSLLAYLVYFTFSAGVHENHLFLASLLATLLAGMSARFWPAAVAFAVLANLNLVLFYGWSGYTQRSLLAGLDASVWLALATCAVIAGFAWGVWYRAGAARSDA